MADAVIGALRVILGADTALFEKNLKGAQSSLAGFNSAIDKAAKAAAASFVALGTATAIAIRSTINEMDKIGKSAQKVGVSAEEFSKLKYAAEIGDVSVEQLEKGLGKLSKTMVEAAAKPTSQAADAFRALGVSVTDSDGKLKTSSQVLLDVAGRFENLKDGAGKTAVSMALFGRAGAELIPFLNEGKAGISGLMKEAESLGLVITSKTAKAADEFNDTLTRLAAVQKVVLIQIAEGMLPSLQNLASRFLDAAKDGETFKGVGESIGNFFTSAVNDIEILITSIGRLGATWQAFKNIFVAPAEGVNPFREFADVVAQNKRVIEDTKLGQMWSAELGKVPAAAAPATKALADFNYQAMNTSENSKKALALSGQMDAEAAAIMKKHVSPAEQLNAELERINNAFARGILTQEQYGIASARVAEQVRESWASSAQTAVSGFGDLAKVFGEKNREMAVAAKGFAIVEATINTYTAFTKALNAGIPPLNYIAAAGTLAAGLAKVVAIKAQQIPGAVTGGSFTVPGGLGGGDKRYTPMMLEPGEQVDIWRPDQLGGDPRGRAGGAREVTIRADGAWRPFVESLIPQLNAAFGDGHKLKLAPA